MESREFLGMMPAAVVAAESGSLSMLKYCLFQPSSVRERPRILQGPLPVISHDKIFSLMWEFLRLCA